MANDNLLIDVSIPSEVPHQSGLENVPNPFQEPTATEEKPSPEMRVAVRTAEQQESAAKEQERRMLLERRDARRKSLGMVLRTSLPDAQMFLPYHQSGRSLLFDYLRNMSVIHRLTLRSKS